MNMKPESDNGQKILKGKSISKGYSTGSAFLYQDILSRNLHYYSIEKEDVSRELARIKEAFGRVLEDIESLEKNVKDELGREQAGIFKAHAEILKDKVLLEDIEKELKTELVNAEHAVKNVFRRWANKFRAAKNEMVKSKAEDMEDLSRKVLCSFMRCEVNILENIPPGSVIVARRLLPSDTVRLKRKNVNGIVVEQGSPVSHSAIIARSLGIPGVAEVKGALGEINRGDELILDGYKGTVIKNPTGKEKTFYGEVIDKEKKVQEKLIKKAGNIAKTRDEKLIKVYANIASVEDVKVAVSRGCDGIGLLRIEQLYMYSKILPDEKYLVKNLSRILKPAENKLVTLRLLDIGADKQLPYIDIEDEPSPVLGLRGVRLLLKYKNLLMTQLKAAYILSKDHQIRLLVPIVTFHQEIEELRQIATECKRQLKIRYGLKRKDIPIGAMIETPAAVENIEKIADVSDFLSIGTNDLVQYSVAAGRDNPNVSEYYEKGSDLAMKYIHRVRRSAARHGIECSVCGEMASELKWIKPLIDVGINVLSVSPYLIPLIKDSIRKI
ncbi:MAG: phosphoenolpyruvate--protein phosphotransferase [Candidatus Omnitrophica bacterium]|nr:phosphoenolpyruvate--protein phosphotransferase [Candidatus Omnitrophota bacterium]